MHRMISAADALDSPEFGKGGGVAQANGWKIVLIDDEADIREVTSIALQDEGYEVVSASDGESGLRLCEEQHPEIVLTDIRMPGISGIDVLKKIKGQQPETEVIVITAFADMDLAIQALQLDASDFITKPIHDDSLHLALRRAKERYTSRRQMADHAMLLERENARTTQELMQSLAFQKNLIENSMDGILGYNENGYVVIFNHSMERLLGYRKSDVLGKKQAHTFFPEGLLAGIETEISDSASSGGLRLHLYESRIVDRAGADIPVQISASWLGAAARQGGTVLFIRDLREIRKLEREMSDQARILHQDKMMSLGRLAASVVHEINNPLSGILNYLRLMLRTTARGALDERGLAKFRQYLDVVEKETLRCSEIVSGLLTFSRISPPAIAAVDIGELLKRSILLGRHRLELGNISSEVTVEPGLPSIEGDFNQLQQCIINLIFNAIDAMPEGGRLFVEARYHKSEKSVHLIVRDTGTGISKSDLPHIFEPFYTTKQEGYGVGLGLSTVYGIVQRHAGAVLVDSDLGTGTTFTLKFPVSLQS
jgi:two-component system NtrC family sensor kinase